MDFDAYARKLHDRFAVGYSQLRCAVPCGSSIPYISYYRCLTVRVSLFPGKLTQKPRVEFAYRLFQFDLPGVPKQLRFQPLEALEMHRSRIGIWALVCWLNRVRQFLARSGGSMTDIQQSPQ